MSEVNRTLAGPAYFEDFAVGDVIRHWRGKTVTEVETVLITNLAMNTAQDHFNEHIMEGGRFPERITFGGITAALVIGLASQDTAETAIEEVSMTNMRLTTPVFHGDTLYAFSEVIDKQDNGVVVFKHTGVNQHGDTVVQLERTVKLAKRSAMSEATA